MLEVKRRGGAPASRQHREIAEETAREVVRQGLAQNTFILCFGLEILESAMAVAPNLKYVWNLEAPPERLSSMKARIAPLAALCCNVKNVTPGFVRTAHGWGKPVLCYTVNTPGVARRALDIGVDGLISDCPQDLMEALS